MSWKSFLGFVAFVTAFAAGAWLIQSQDWSSPNVQSAVPLISSSEADLELLEEAAFESCMCDRRSGSEASCDDIYDSARKQMLGQLYGEQSATEPAIWATACMPVSTRGECFDFTDGQKCITTGYSLNAASPSIENRSVCSAEEARALGDAFNEHSFAGVDDMMRRILAGEPVPTSEPNGGCAG